MVRRAEEKAGVGFAQHCGVVVGVACRHGEKIERLEGGDGMFLLVLHPHMVGQDPARGIDLQLIAEEGGKSELAHERQGELIEGIGQNNHLAAFTEPGHELGGAFQRPHLVDDRLNVGDGEPVLIQDGEAALHQRVVVRHFPGRDLEFLDAGFQRDVDPDFRDQHAFEVEAGNHWFLHVFSFLNKEFSGARLMAIG